MANYLSFEAITIPLSALVKQAATPTSVGRNPASLGGKLRMHCFVRRLY
jgi:hypothetical protein